jgi:hypothetical protein
MIKGGGEVPPDISSVRDTLSTVLPGRATDRPNDIIAGTEMRGDWLA